MKRLFVLVLSILLVLLTIGCSSTDYAQATELFLSGNYSDAAVLFESLGDYKDSTEFLTECNYNIAFENYFNKNYSSAIQIFESLGNYKASFRMINKCSYALGMEAFENEDYNNASVIFKKLGNYEDSKEMYKACEYNKLMSYIVKNGEYSSSGKFYFIEELDAANAYHFLTTDNKTISYRYYALWETSDSYFHFYYECNYTLDSAPYYSLDYMQYKQKYGALTESNYVQIEGYLDIYTNKIISVISQELVNVDLSEAKEIVIETQEEGLDFTKSVIKKSGINLTYEELFG